MKIKLKYISWFLLGLALFFYPVSLHKYKAKKDIFKQDKICLKEMIWNEARNTSKREKIAILEVAINRYKNDKYPDSICEVIRQPFQYSYLNNKDKSQIILPRFQELKSNLDKEAYWQIWNIVESKFNNEEVLPNIVLPENALYYHTKTINKPYWARSKKIKKVQKGVDKEFKHQYYRTISAVR